MASFAMSFSTVAFAALNDFLTWSCRWLTRPPTCASGIPPA